MSTRLCLTLTITCAIAACGYGSSPASPTGSPTPSTNSGNSIFIGNGSSGATTAAFGANPLTIAAGTTLTWANQDSTAHTATANAGTWNSGTIAPGASFSFTFTSPGTFPYRCTLHTNMVGTVVVQ